MIRAEVNNTYFRKFLWVGLICLGYVAWFGYDGLIGYPKQIEIAEAYEAIPETPEKHEIWEELTAENGWSKKKPKKTAEEIRGSIQGQFYMLFGSLAAGLFFLGKWYLPRGSYIEGDENEIQTSSGLVIDLDTIYEIDKKKWADKGIAVIRYSEGDFPRRYVLDDFKYDREPTGKILDFAEAALKSNKAESTSEPQSNEGAENDQESQEDSDISPQHSEAE